MLKRRLREQPHGHQRILGPALPRNEEHQGDYAADESAEDRGGNPARLVASDEGLGDAEYTERGQGQADEVDVSEDTAALREPSGWLGRR